MTNTDLLIRLRNLHEELSAINLDVEPGEQVDDSTIDALGQLVTDVGTLIDQAKGVSEESDVDHKTLVDRVVEFDREHPRVSRFLTQMTDLLAMVGI